MPTLQAQAVKTSARPAEFEDDFDDAEIGGEFGDFPLDPDRIDVDSIIALTARLAQVLAHEADLLADMEVAEIATLQREKVALLDALEAQKKFIERNPKLVERISDEDALEFAQLVELFQNVLRENHRRLLVAREVNRSVVEAITEAVHDASRGGIYDERGRPEKTAKPISMSLNQTI